MAYQYQQPQGAYPPQTQYQAHGSGAYHPSDTGSFEGGGYSITHRDTNTILTLTLNGGGAKVRPGAMIEMSGGIKLQGKTKLSFKKILLGDEMHESLYSGNGIVVLAPPLFGDIATLQLDGSSTWSLNTASFLAATMDVHKESKSQGIGKSLFSGEDLFVYRVTGRGLLWMHSFGAITRRELGQGEEHIVDNGHLVAWNCNYKAEKAGGGIFSSMKTGEGVVCRFTGPGTVYIQTRNLDDFNQYIADMASAKS